jgi:FlaG/FlaF family flagellin (archaellin)
LADAARAEESSLKRRIHLAITVILAAALCSEVFVLVSDRSQTREQLQTRTQENTALRKRAETAEANTRLVIERFAEAMKSFANEAGHFSGRSLGKYEKSFVQVYAFYRKDGRNMATAGTACYLGGKYFLTAKHIVIQEAASGTKPPKTTRIEVRINRQMVAVQLIDNGETQEREQIDIGDWAVLVADRIPEGLVALKPNPTYSFMFGERLVRYGNDSNRGIAPAAGYVAQVSESGWISWLVDSLPGCSGGGVLNAKDELVGLNGGYLDGSTRLAVIIPIRSEMFRRLPKDLSSVSRESGLGTATR